MTDPSANDVWVTCIPFADRHACAIQNRAVKNVSRSGHAASGFIFEG